METSTKASIFKAKFIQNIIFSQVNIFASVEKKATQSRSPSLRSSRRNARLWDNPLPEARNNG